VECLTVEDSSGGHRVANCVLACSCKYHNRMGIPCRHISSVIKGTKEISNIYNNGFPLLSVKAYWLLSYYYFGLSETNEYSNIWSALANLAKTDSKGVPLNINLGPLDQYNVPEAVLETFHAPPEARTTQQKRPSQLFNRMGTDATRMFCLMVYRLALVR